MKKAILAAVAMGALLAVASTANAEPTKGGAGEQAAEALAQQIVTAAKGAEANDQGQGKSTEAVEADIEAAVLATIRDSAASPDVVAKAIALARKTPGLDQPIEVALGDALQLALGATLPGPGSNGRGRGGPPFGNGNGGGGGGGGSGYRGNGNGNGNGH
jgi:hypothetical protein